MVWTQPHRGATNHSDLRFGFSVVVVDTTCHPLPSLKSPHPSVSFFSSVKNMAAASAPHGGGASAEVSGGVASAEFSVTDPSAQESVVVKIGRVGDAGVGERLAACLSARSLRLRRNPCRQNELDGEVCGGLFRRGARPPRMRKLFHFYTGVTK